MLLIAALFCLLLASTDAVIDIFAWQRTGTGTLLAYVEGSELPFEIDLKATGMLIPENITVMTADTSYYAALPETQYTTTILDSSSVTISVFGPSRTGAVIFSITGEMGADLSYATFDYTYTSDLKEVITSFVITRSIFTFTSTWESSHTETSTGYFYNDEFLVASKWILVPTSYVTTTEEWTEQFISTTTTTGADNTVTIIVQSPESVITDTITNPVNS